MATAVSTPKKQPPIPPASSVTVDTPPTNSQIQGSSTPVSILETSNADSDCNCGLAKRLGPMPPQLPGKIWVPCWGMQDAPSNKSFDELLLDKIKGPTGTEAAKKRRKVHMKTKLINDTELLHELQTHEKESKEKEEKKLKRAEEKEKKKRDLEKKKQPAKKKIAFLKEVAGQTSSEEEEEESELESETEDEEIVSEDESVEVEEDEETNESRLINLWRSLCLPTTEEEIKQKWYGVVYTIKGKEYLYVGKVLKRFLEDVDGPAMALEIDCLKPHVGSGSVLESYDPNCRDVGTFPTHIVIYGPLKVEPLKGNKWSVPAYDELKRFFQQSEGLKKKELFKSVFKQ